MQMLIVGSFRGSYRWLSNFYPSEIRTARGVYATAEHAYQAAKCADPEEAAQIRAAATPAVAKKLGRRFRLRPEAASPDWRIFVMGQVIARKFAQNPDLAQRLVDTGDAELFEGNTWGDRFWGVCDGIGKNHLGLLLMAEREHLKASTRR
jgi:ribA/ribD-fused uncharacterized protein